MSSFTRNSVRATAAAAGIVALGLGVAAPAFAAPSLPSVPQLPGAGAAHLPSTPGAGSFTAMTDAVTAAARSLSNLPGSFEFANPMSDTSSAATGYTTPVSQDAVSAPDLDEVHAPAMDPESAVADNGLAPTGTPSAASLTALAQKATAMTNGNEFSIR